MSDRGYLTIIFRTWGMTCGEPANGEAAGVMLIDGCGNVLTHLSQPWPYHFAYVLAPAKHRLDRRLMVEQLIARTRTDEPLDPCVAIDRAMNPANYMVDLDEDNRLWAIHNKKENARVEREERAREIAKTVKP